MVSFTEQLCPLSSRSRPLARSGSDSALPGKLTHHLEIRGMSGKCQSQKWSILFDHLVGTGEY
jgi:hypothetical protein